MKEKKKKKRNKNTFCCILNRQHLLSLLPLHSLFSTSNLTKGDFVDRRSPPSLSLSQSFFMSDYEALKIFSRQPVSLEMVEFLAATTCSVIQVKPITSTTNRQGDVVVTPVKKEAVPLTQFISRLIEYSNVQTPTLMASLVYLNRLRNALPGNAVGIETTRHRIFLASLILSAKSLNDSSPLNKHWTKYTDGLLSNKDVNSAERELIGILKWNLRVDEKELVAALQPFLTRIKKHLQRKQELECNAKAEYYRMSSFYSNNSLASSRSSSKSSIFSASGSNYSLRSSASSSHNLVAEKDALYSSPANTARMPLAARLSTTLNQMRKIDYYKASDDSGCSGGLLPPAVV